MKDSGGTFNILSQAVILFSGQSFVFFKENYMESLGGSLKSSLKIPPTKMKIIPNIMENQAAQLHTLILSSSVHRAFDCHNAWQKLLHRHYSYILEISFSIRLTFKALL